MKQIQIDYINSCGLTEQEIAAVQQTLLPEINHLRDAQHDAYNTKYASINLPQDTQLIEAVQSLAAQKRALNPTMLIVIGIGGSNLGTAALVQALHGVFYNKNRSVKVYFADTVDPDYIHELVTITQNALSQGEKIILNVISKSGTTTETVANFQVFLEVLQQYHPHDYQQYIVITSDYDSTLHEYAKQNHIDFLGIPTKVGGRYSVFSAVGLFPLALLGINIEELCAGARSGLELSLHNQYTENPAAISAIILYLLYKKGYVIHNLFLFSSSLENIGLWYRQLMAESIGKKYDNNNNVVHNGILPTVSIGSTDLHSVGQLYLSGPYNIMTTFMSFLNFEQSTKTNKVIMNAILKGTQIAYNKDNRPFVDIVIPEKTAYYIAQFMQIKMCEIMYLGFLMNVNPFDQPQVELYKEETKKLLETTI